MNSDAQLHTPRTPSRPLLGSWKNLTAPLGWGCSSKSMMEASSVACEAGGVRGGGITALVLCGGLWEEGQQEVRMKNGVLVRISLYVPPIGTAT